MKTTLGIIFVIIAIGVIGWAAMNSGRIYEAAAITDVERSANEREIKSAITSKDLEAEMLRQLELAQMQMRAPLPNDRSVAQWERLKDDLYAVDSLGMQKSHAAQVYHAARKAVLGVGVNLEIWIDKQDDPHMKNFVKRESEKSFEDARASVASAIETLRSVSRSDDK